MDNETRYAGFWKRVIAHLIDGTILDFSAFLVLLLFLGATYWIKRLTGQEYFSSDSLMLKVFILGVRFIFSAVYHCWGIYRFGTTPGKKLFKIYIVGAAHLQPITFGQSVIRYLSYAVSFLPFGAGALMVVFHPKKQALHDLIAGTVSVIRDESHSGQK